MRQTHVISGGLGFIGGHLALELLREGHEVHVIDNLVTSSFSATDSQFTKYSHFYFHDMDLADKNAKFLRQFEEVLKKANYFFHFANPVGVAYIDKDPHQAISDMNRINQAILSVLVETKIKTFFSSSSEVYGNRVNATEDDELTIGSPKQLRWGYACGKLMMEFLLRSHRVPHITLRFFNVTGAGQSPAQGMVLPRFISAIKSNQDLLVYGDGSQVRAFCDVEDAIKMILALIKKDEFDGGVYNIGNEKNVISIKALAEKVIALSGSKSKIVYKEFKSIYGSETGEILRRVPNTQKISSLYCPVIDIDTCIKKMLSSGS